MIKGVFASQFSKKGVSRLRQLHANAVWVSSLHLKNLPFGQLKREGIQVYAEISLFVGEDLWRKYPDCRPLDRAGNQMPKIEWYAGVCPNHPEVRKDKLQLIKQLIEKYPIKGLWLDFIRYPCHWEPIRKLPITEYCFCKNCRDKFAQEIEGKLEGKAWTEWKCYQIADFIAEVRGLINQSGRAVTLGAFAVPWQDHEFDGAVTRVIGQDFKIMAASGVEVFSPMVYHRICERKIDWISKMTKYIASATNKKVLPIVQVADFPEDKKDKISMAELRDVVRLATLPPSTGMILFTLDRLIQARKIKKIRL